MSLLVVGSIALDTSFLIVLISVYLLQMVVVRLPF